RRQLDHVRAALRELGFGHRAFVRKELRKHTGIPEVHSMRTSFFALIALVSFAAYGDVYKWTDASGNVHYGDKPRDGADKVDVKPGIGSGSPSDPAAAKADQDRAAACAKKKSQLESYKTATVVKETDALGRAREYSEPERQQLIAQTEKQVADACK